MLGEASEAVVGPRVVGVDGEPREVDRQSLKRRRSLSVFLPKAARNSSISTEINRGQSRLGRLVQVMDAEPLGGRQKKGTPGDKVNGEA